MKYIIAVLIFVFLCVSASAFTVDNGVIFSSNSSNITIISANTTLTSLIVDSAINLTGEDFSYVYSTTSNPNDMQITVNNYTYHNYSIVSSFNYSADMLFDIGVWYTAISNGSVVANRTQSAFTIDVNMTAKELILNLIPVLLTVYITPGPAETSDNLHANYTIYEHENDSIYLVSTDWYLGGVIQPLLHNVTNMSFSETSDGDSWKLELQVFDGYAWSFKKNSSTILIGDSIAPVFTEASLSSGAGQNDAAFIIFTNVSEAGEVSFVYAEVENPNGIKANYSMTWNGQKYARTFIPSTDGTYNIDFYAKDGSGNIRYYDSPLAYTESTGVGSSGGGGGTTVIYDVGDIGFAVSPAVEYITISAGSRRTIEFQVTNSGIKNINITAKIIEDGASEWMSFENGKDTIQVYVSRIEGLTSNKRFIDYTISVPDDVALGEYTGTIELSSGNVVTLYRVTVDVQEGFAVWLTDFLSRRIFDFRQEVCADPLTEDECTEFRQVGLSITWLHIIIVAGFGIVIYIGSMVYRRKRRKK